MSVKIMGQMWEVQVTQRDLLVLLALADHADHNGNNAFPSIPLLAWKIGAAENTVRRALRRLEKMGVIEAKPRPGKSTVYSIYPERAPQKPPFKTVDPSHSYGTPSKLEPLPRHEKKKRGTPTTPSAKSEHEPSIKEPSTLLERPLVFQAYEDAFGFLLTPMLADELKLLVEEYTEAWVIDAMRITVTSGKRSLGYAKAILRRWQNEGKTPAKEQLAKAAGSFWGRDLTDGE